MIRRSWAQAASIEETLALWAASLREVKKRIRPLFGQERVARNAGLFLEGLLGDEQRKTGWMRAEAAGDPGPWRQQAILGRRDWDADALRDIVRDYVIEHLADNDAVLVIDETGFLKQGKASCGVARQYTGSAGKITNCQIGVFAAYVSRHGHAFIDRALYLPKEWTDDPDRLEAAYVPPDAGFATKPKLATRMIARAIAASVPFKWVAGDTVYGVGDIEQQLRHAGKGYVLLSGNVTGLVAGATFTVTDGPFSKGYTATVNAAGTGCTAAIPSSDALTLANGTATVTAQVTDAAGNVSVSETVQVAVSETLPTVTINPVDGNNVINHAEAAAGVALSGNVVQA